MRRRLVRPTLFWILVGVGINLERAFHPGFRNVLWLDGTISVDLQAIRLRAGESFGTIALKPDRELAYRDPMIHAIWNGTLEFPTQSTVAPQPATAQQENGSGK